MPYAKYTPAEASSMLHSSYDIGEDAGYLDLFTNTFRDAYEEGVTGYVAKKAVSFLNVHIDDRKMRWDEANKRYRLEGTEFAYTEKDGNVYVQSAIERDYNQAIESSMDEQNAAILNQSPILGTATSLAGGFAAGALDPLAIFLGAAVGRAAVGVFGIGARTASRFVPPLRRSAMLEALSAKNLAKLTTTQWRFRNAVETVFGTTLVDLPAMAAHSVDYGERFEKTDAVSMIVGSAALGFLLAGKPSRRLTVDKIDTPDTFKKPTPPEAPPAPKGPEVPRKPDAPDPGMELEMARRFLPDKEGPPPAPGSKDALYATILDRLREEALPPRILDDAETTPGGPVGRPNLDKIEGQPRDLDVRAEEVTTTRDKIRGMMEDIAERQEEFSRLMADNDEKEKLVTEVMDILAGRIPEGRPLPEPGGRSPRMTADKELLSPEAAKDVQVVEDMVRDLVHKYGDDSFDIVAAKARLADWGKGRGIDVDLGLVDRARDLEIFRRREGQPQLEHVPIPPTPTPNKVRNIGELKRVNATRKNIAAAFEEADVAKARREFINHFRRNYPDARSAEILEGWREFKTRMDMAKAHDYLVNADTDGAAMARVIAEVRLLPRNHEFFKLLVEGKTRTARKMFYKKFSGLGVPEKKLQKVWLLARHVLPYTRKELFTKKYAEPFWFAARSSPLSITLR